MRIKRKSCQYAPKHKELISFVERFIYRNEAKLERLLAMLKNCKHDDPNYVSLIFTEDSSS